MYGGVLELRETLEYDFRMEQERGDTGLWCKPDTAESGLLGEMTDFMSKKEYAE